MARFVLVHGAFAGAWIWGRTHRSPEGGRYFQRRQFDLPGLGDDHTPASEVTLDACASRLCEILAENSERAFVVGNIIGGIIATQGAARCPERVAGLVYVAAFLPRDGQSLLDLEPPGRRRRSGAGHYPSKESLRLPSWRPRPRVMHCTDRARRTSRPGLLHGSARNRSRRS